MSQTDLSKAGTILLLVGAILGAVLAIFFVALAFGIQALLSALGEQEGAFVGWIYGGLALVMLAGSGFGFVAYSKANQGDLNGGFVFGLVASLLPPLQIIPLLGAIFCKISEDAQT